MHNSLIVLFVLEYLIIIAAIILILTKNVLSAKLLRTFTFLVSTPIILVLIYLHVRLDNKAVWFYALFSILAIILYVYLCVHIFRWYKKQPKSIFKPLGTRLFCMLFALYTLATIALNWVCSYLPQFYRSHEKPKKFTQDDWLKIRNAQYKYRKPHQKLRSFVQSITTKMYEFELRGFLEDVRQSKKYNFDSSYPHKPITPMKNVPVTATHKQVVQNTLLHYFDYEGYVRPEIDLSVYDYTWTIYDKDKKEILQLEYTDNKTLKTANLPEGALQIFINQRGMETDSMDQKYPWMNVKFEIVVDDQILATKDMYVYTIRTVDDLWMTNHQDGLLLGKYHDDHFTQEAMSFAVVSDKKNKQWSSKKIGANDTLFDFINGPEPILTFYVMSEKQDTESSDSTVII